MDQQLPGENRIPPAPGPTYRHYQEQAPSQQMPAQQTPAQQTPLQQTPVQQVPAQQTTQQQAPTQQTQQQVPQPYQQVPQQQSQIPQQQLPSQQQTRQYPYQQAQPEQQRQAQPAQPQQQPVQQTPQQQTSTQQQAQQPTPQSQHYQQQQSAYAASQRPTYVQPGQTQAYVSQHYQTQQSAPAAVGAYQPATHAARPKKEGKGTSRLVPIIMGFVGVLVGALLTAGVLFIVTDGFKPTEQSNTGNATSTSTSQTHITINPPAEDATLAEAVAAKTLPSVVNIDVYASYGGGFYDDWSGSDEEYLEEYGLGSGVVISEDGYILTNYHVVEGGTEYLVRFDPRTQFKAKVVGYDESSDLAVLKVDAKGLIPMEIGDSTKVKVGEWVMALGSPFGLEKSVSTGIVSALFRSTAMESTNGMNFYANMIQTDAAINPGNSGGALVNAKGELIGINTLISSANGSSAGVGFAIPSNYAMHVAEQIMAGKVVEHAYLGIKLRSVDAGNASSLNSSVDAGAYIAEVVPGSPAEKAGLKVGDVITGLDELPISSAAELVINIRGHFVGDKVKIEFQRNGSKQTVEVTLGSDSSA